MAKKSNPHTQSDSGNSYTSRTEIRVNTNAIKNNIKNKSEKIPQRTKVGALICLLLSMVLLGWGGTQITDLRTSYSVRQFLPENHPLLIIDDKIREHFQISLKQPLLAAITLKQENNKTASWLDEKEMTRLNTATTAIAAIQGVESVISLANVEIALETEDGIQIGPLISQVQPQHWQEHIKGSNLLTPVLVSKDLKNAMISVELTGDDPKSIAKVRTEIKNQLSQIFPNEVVQLGGIPSIQTELSRLLTTELKNLCLFALLAAIIALLAVFKSVSSVLIPLYISGVSIVVALIGMIITDTPFTVISSTLPILISVTVVSMATHTMIRFAKDLQLAEYKNGTVVKSQQILATMKTLFLPNLLTALTTLVGFLSLTTTNSPLIRQYGFCVGFAVMISWACTMLLLPPLLVFCPVPKIRRWTQASARWTFFILRHKKAIFISTIATTAFLGIFGLKLNWSPILFDDLPAKQEARVSTELIDKKLGGMIPLEIVVSSQASNDWNNPNKVAKLDQLAATWRKYSEIGSVISLSDFLRVSNKELPQTRQTVAETIFLYSLSDTNPLLPYLTADALDTRIGVRLKDLPATKLQNTIAKLHGEAALAFPQSKISIAGMATTAHTLNNEIAKTLIHGFWLALLFIGIMLVFVFRSIRWSLLAIVPNLVPPLALLGFLALGNTPIKPSIALIFSIALGLAFNNTVYMLSRLKGLIDTGNYHSPPIGKTLYKEGLPCILSTISLIAGFSAFTTSYFAANQIFGLYMLLSIVMGLVGDLLLLPTLIAIFPGILPKNKWYEKPASIPPASNSILATNNSEISIQVATPTTPGSTVRSTIAIITALIITFIYPVDSYQKTKSIADRILDKVVENIKSESEEAKVTLEIIDKNRKKKIRVINIKRMSKSDKEQAMIRLVSPRDLKGVSLLSLHDGKNRNQWLYDPKKSKRSRRILLDSQGKGFMDSDLSYEDIGGSVGTIFKNKLIRYEKHHGQKVAVIDSLPHKNKSTYGKIRTWVPLNSYVIIKTEYYDKKGRLLKVAKFKKYKLFGKKIWRARFIEIENKIAKRQTVVSLESLKINEDGAAAGEDFTLAALEDI